MAIAIEGSQITSRSALLHRDERLQLQLPSHPPEPESVLMLAMQKETEFLRRVGSASLLHVYLVQILAFGADATLSVT